MATRRGRETTRQVAGLSTDLGYVLALSSRRIRSCLNHRPPRKRREEGRGREETDPCLSGRAWRKSRSRCTGGGRRTRGRSKSEHRRQASPTQPGSPTPGGAPPPRRRRLGSPCLRHSRAAELTEKETLQIESPNEQLQKKSRFFAMRLLHLTNYYGAVIRPRRNRGNEEVAFPCIWTQAVPGYRKGCCPGFGRRSIFVGNRADDYQKTLSGLWSVYFVSETTGRNPKHLFLKFVIVPTDSISNFRNASYAHGPVSITPSFEFIGEFDSSCDPGAALDRMLSGYYKEKKKKGVFVHLHVGLCLNELRVGRPRARSRRQSRH